MFEPFELPEWVRQRLLSDEAYANAYHDTLPHRRAMIKSTIARLHALLGERREVSTLATRQLDGGLLVEEVSERASLALFRVDPLRVSVAQLLAAIAPAQLAGVENIVVVRETEVASEQAGLHASAVFNDNVLVEDPDYFGGQSIDEPWPAGLLAALELAGVDTVMDATFEECCFLLDQVEEFGGWAVHVSLADGAPLNGGPTFNVEVNSFDDFWIWADAADDFDLEDIVWAYGAPEMRIRSCGALQAADEDWFFYLTDDFEQFCAPHAMCKLAPEERLERVAGAAPLVLGPDALGLWLWPNLTPATFFATRRTVIG